MFNPYQIQTDGRKKIEDMYHPTQERSEFYTMSDVMKPPVLFTPSEELEKVCDMFVMVICNVLFSPQTQQINSGEINFYAGQPGDLSSSGFENGHASNGLPPIPTNATLVGLVLLKCIQDVYLLCSFTESITRNTLLQIEGWILWSPLSRRCFLSHQSNG